MQVKPLITVTQTIGSLSVVRVAGYPFDLDVETARKAALAGLVEPLEPIPPHRRAAQDREVKA